MKPSLDSLSGGASPAHPDREHPASNLTPAYRESSTQPRQRAPLPTEFRRTPITRCPQPTAPLPPSAQLGARLMASAQKLKRQGIDKLRASRRAIVDAELEAWNAMGPSDTALIRAEKVMEKSRGEEFAFGVIFTLALIGVLWGMAQFMGWTDSLAQFVGFARQLLG